MFILASKKCSMRTSEPGWNSKALTVSKRDVDAKLTRRFQQGQGHQIGSTRHLRTYRLGLVHVRFVINDATICSRILNHNSRQLLLLRFKIKLSQVSDNHVNSETIGTRTNARNSLGMHVFINEEGFAQTFRCRKAHNHRFGSGCTFVQ